MRCIEQACNQVDRVFSLTPMGEHMAPPAQALHPPQRISWLCCITVTTFAVEVDTQNCFSVTGSDALTMNLNQHVGTLHAWLSWHSPGAEKHLALSVLPEHWVFGLASYPNQKLYCCCLPCTLHSPCVIFTVVLPFACASAAGQQD